MSPLHSPSATPAAPHRNAKLNALHPRLRNLGLELRNGLALFQPASASRTAGRQRYFDNFINRGGKGPGITAPILLSHFASGSLGVGFGFLPREGSRLSLRRPGRPLPQTAPAFVLFLSYFHFSFDPFDFFCVFLFFPL